MLEKGYSFSIFEATYISCPKISKKSDQATTNTDNMTH
jgi:hypothetical protein